MQLQTKSLDIAACDFKMSNAGTFEGYASVFGAVDSYMDTILAGAFKSTLKKFGIPKMFFNHGSYDIPIGKYKEAYEDSKGLIVVGELTKGNRLAEDVKLALEHKTIDGLSIGYRLSKDDFTFRDDGIRVIKSVTKLSEISIVTFPADGAARVTAVKAEDIESLSTVREIEGFLRDVAGLSKSDAGLLIAQAKRVFSDGGAEAKEHEELALIAQRIQNLNTKIKG